MLKGTDSTAEVEGSDWGGHQTSKSDRSWSSIVKFGGTRGGFRCSSLSHVPGGETRNPNPNRGRMSIYSSSRFSIVAHFNFFQEVWTVQSGRTV